ncbi:sugar phosphate isomerase/epimerase [uncultured Maribacter sp.]|uniref:sugar phosphate isomerase/epimerase n=1 Tax=uncultured Maribacter sp. TaxID=431308 RepID=UPI0030DDBE56|tara:strand:- start:533 stop:1363 length:831 start_codon:yes stop_codon:yes gene_type:complete
MKKINYLYPHWGSSHLSVSEFFDSVKIQNFQGVEINLPENETFEKEFLRGLEKSREKNPNFICVLQQVLPVKLETVEAYLLNVLTQLERMLPYYPNFINSHTGKDHFSFEENCLVIEAIESFSVQNNIPVYHEIHRGRFTFHSATTLSYLEEYPQLKLVGDLSHWCVVSESMLQDQEYILDKIIPHIKHIHARVGFEQAPQVINPFAPEWKSYLDQYLVWWQRIINEHAIMDAYTITPEFGPYPYMPQNPLSKKPLANQYELNCNMKTFLKSRLKF